MRMCVFVREREKEGGREGERPPPLHPPRQCFSKKWRGACDFWVQATGVLLASVYRSRPPLPSSTPSLLHSFSPPLLLSIPQQSPHCTYFWKGVVERWVRRREGGQVIGFRTEQAAGWTGELRRSQHNGLNEEGMRGGKEGRRKRSGGSTAGLYLLNRGKNGRASCRERV